jgi:FAD/FMN-containing dehydrogenase
MARRLSQERLPPKAVTRREFGSLAGVTAVAAFLGRSGTAAAASLPRLPKLSESEALLLQASDPRYGRYQPAFNQRTMLQPALRAVCRTPSAVATLVDWARSNDLPFALRSGGHSFEGFSQSTSVVIDTRELAGIEIDPARNRISVGAGASLGAIYRFLAPRGLVLPAGSCPTVGISGHTLGGGYGLLARALGLLCDSLLAIDLVDAEARRITVGPADMPDLFWACRGGGGGSFGAATRFTFQAYRQPNILIFSVSWLLPIDRALRLFKAWQSWSPQAPDPITASMIVGRRGKLISLSCSGQSLGPRGQFSSELNALLAVAQPSRTPVIAEVGFLQAVNFFSGGWAYQSTYSKGKSDIVLQPLRDDGIATLLQGILSFPAGAVVAICDPYGGAISRVASDETAFVYRAGTLYSIQYYTSWDAPRWSDERLAEMRNLYASMRPYVTGASYVNYCDLDLANWQTAYWGTNLPRLSRIKAAFDPENVFRHAQGVPI